MAVNKWAYRPEVCDRDFCPGVCDRCSKALILNGSQDKIDAIAYLMRQILIVPNHKREKDCSRKGEWTYMPVKNTSRLDCYEVLWQIQDILETNRWWLGRVFTQPTRVKERKPQVPLTFTLTEETSMKSLLGIFDLRGIKEAKIKRKDDGGYYVTWEEDAPDGEDDTA